MKNDFNYVLGDITAYIEYEKPLFVIHGCNCCNIMGAGVAGALASKWDNIPQADANYLRHTHGRYVVNPKKLGKYSTAIVLDNTTIVNMYTQLEPGSGQFDIDALKLGMTKFIKEYYIPNPKDFTLLIPRIGCSLAKSKHKTEAEAWEEVKTMLIPLFNQYQISLSSITIIGK